MPRRKKPTTTPPKFPPAPQPARMLALPGHDEIEAHVKAVRVDRLELSDVCSIWHAARPIVVALIGIPFIPAKWRQLVQMLVASMDAACPVTAR